MIDWKKPEDAIALGANGRHIVVLRDTGGIDVYKFKIEGWFIVPYGVDEPVFAVSDGVVAWCWLEEFTQILPEWVKK